MHMVDPPAAAFRKAPRWLDMMTQHAERLLAEVHILKMSPPVLGAEDQMQPDLSQ